MEFEVVGDEDKFEIVIELKTLGEVGGKNEGDRYMM